MKTVLTERFGEEAVKDMLDDGYDVEAIGQFAVNFAADAQAAKELPLLALPQEGKFNPAIYNKELLKALNDKWPTVRSTKLGAVR